MNTKAPNIADVIFPQILREILWPPVAVEATDGTLYRSAWGAFLHDLVERKWAELKPTLRSVEEITRARNDLRVSSVELAREAGISLSLLRKIERNERELTEAVADKLWAALWRLQVRIPTKVDVLIRLEHSADGRRTTAVTTCRETLKGL